MFSNTLASSIFAATSFVVFLLIVGWASSKLANVLHTGRRARRVQEEEHLATIKEAKELMKLTDEEADNRTADSLASLTAVGDSLDEMVDRMKEINARMAATAERANELAKS